MPDRYWVGGTASWDGTAGTKWAATSGGTGGASVPTSADAVFFDANSTGTCTIATGNTGAASINCTGFTGTITGSAAITVSGSVTLVAAMTYSHTGTVTFNGTGTLTTAGKTFSGVTVDGAGITLTLGSALTTTGARNVTVTTGTFTTAGFAVTTNTLLSSSTAVRAINLGASTVTLAGSSALTFSGANLTFNAGTSQINVTTAGGVINGDSALTFNNVSFTAGSGSGNNSVVGSHTFNNLTVSPPGAAFATLMFSGNQTITGTLTAAGSTQFARCFLRSNTMGTTRTLTVATLSAADCDFRDITLAGAAAGSSPTRAGNCGGNSGITFPAAKTVYRVGTAVDWPGSNSWATSSGGTGDNINFPLAQDTVIIDNVAAPSTGTISTGGPYNTGALDCSARTSALTLNFTSGHNYHGSFTLGSGITVSGTATPQFVGRGTMDFTSASKTITFPFIVDAFGGTLRLLDALTLSISNFTSLTHNQGTLNLNNFTITFTGANSGTFDTNNSNTRTLAFGTGNITIANNGSFNAATQTGLTVTGTPVVNLSSSGTPSFNAGPATEANSITFNITTGTYTLTVNTSSVRNINFTGFAGTLSNSGGQITVFGDVTFSTGMTIGGGFNRWNFSSTSGTPRTITTNGRTVDFPLWFDGVGGTWRLLDALTQGSTRATTMVSGTLDLNGFTMTVGSSFATTATGTRNLTFNGGTLVCPNSGTTAFNNAAPTGFTTTAGTGTGTINMTSASAKTFVGGGSTFNCTLNNGGAGALTITGSNTFTTLSNTVQPTSFLFTAGTTTTLTNWNINGTAGNLVTIGSPTAAQHTLFKASGTVTADYLSISYSNATGGATWSAGVNSVNGGNNAGWFPATANFFMLLF
jgi:hypothetical protein